MIGIVDYGLGNTGSILNMLKRVGAPAKVMSAADELEQADKLILPGIGAFDEGMRMLDESGLRPLLDDMVLRRKTPILGICLGMQLFTRGSEEGRLPGLGWIDAYTRKFNFYGESRSLRVPHMGWNTLAESSCEYLSGFAEEPRFYFVHSYHVVCDNPDEVAATTTYGYEFASSVRRENIFGTQFHPEKSHKFGLALLASFARSERQCA